MATTKVGAPSVGAAWAYVLKLWERFATGEFTSWAYAISTLNTGYSIEITVGLPAGGTDLYKVQMLDTDSSSFVPATYPFLTPGWRTLIQTLLPATVPGGTATDIAYTNGPWSLRQNLLVALTNGSWSSGASNQRSLGDIGQLSSYFGIFRKNNLVMLDITGILWAPSGALDVLLGQPTDLEGNPTAFVSAGSGGTPDMAPVVAALQDIALREVDGVFNQGGALWSMYGKVRVP